MTTNIIYPNDILKSRKDICLEEEKLDVDEGKFQILFSVQYFYSMWKHEKLVKANETWKFTFINRKLQQHKTISTFI